MATELRKQQLRKDTSTNWTANNPILLEGEFGFESDTGKLKIGDGVTDWVTLPYKVTNISYGTAEPTGGTDGDIYFQISE